jgi:hypothetical protein
MRWRLPDWLKGGVVGGLVGSIISGLSQTGATIR